MTKSDEKYRGGSRSPYERGNFPRLADWKKFRWRFYSLGLRDGHVYPVVMERWGAAFSGSNRTCRKSKFERDHRKLKAHLAR